jgi:subtilisin family serine protease
MAALRPLVLAAVLLSTLALAAGAQGRPGHTPGPLVEVVVALDGAPLADSGQLRRLSAHGRTVRRLDLHARATVSRLRTLASAQRSAESRLEAAVPDASVRLRYRIVANGLAVTVPASEVGRLEHLPGVKTVYPSVTYRAALDRAPQQIGAPALWGPGLTDTLGDGIKIGIIDQGVDVKHPFFDPTGYAMPAGYPKGQAAYTSAKVIVARAFPPPGATWEGASLPFHGSESAHGTHVAGIAAGNAGTRATFAGNATTVSGVAPRAYIGNYNALTVPTGNFGLNGNSPQILAAIEAAVSDGMDVINLSLQEAEIEPSRDVVPLALDAAARAGVVPVVAAGNDFEELGGGSIGSPASSTRAISVGSVTTTRGGRANQMSSFSSEGPTPLSLRLKPDVTAPGSNILSAEPGGWELLSGTSMASPMVAGAAALLRQRHPDWSVDQLKSALVTTGDNAVGDPPVTRQGGGVVNLARADVPLLFVSPTSVGLGLVRRGTNRSVAVTLGDAGGGAGDWTVAVDPRTQARGVTIAPAAPTVGVPGTFTLRVAVAATALQGDVSGRILLTHGTDVRRIPFWFRVNAPTLGKPSRTLAAPGTYTGTTKGRPARVLRYRYPERPNGFGFAVNLAGPEQVFRVRLRGRVANFGVVITSRAKGVRVEPRIVAAGDENRLTGLSALPFTINPYLTGYGEPVLASAAISPAPGLYDVVFDSATRQGAGAFTFRYWVNDRTPPRATLPNGRTVRAGEPLTVRLSDAGSGVDPASIRIAIDGRTRAVPALSKGLLAVQTGGLAAGRHTLRIQVSDYQETRNMENVGGVLPNTRVAAATIVVR